MKQPTWIKFVSFTVVAVFICLTYTPGIHADVYTDNTILTCMFFTIEGIHEVEAEVGIEDAERLSQLMHKRTFNNDVIVFELNRLVLLPETISEKLAN